ncbi:hypothetical protein D3C81_948230 [compost metagenome]
MVKHRRRVQRTAADIAVTQPGTGGNGVVHYLLELDRGGLVDHGAHVDLRVHRVAIVDGLGLLHQQLDKAVGHGFMHQHALDRRAALARILVRAAGRERGGFFQVGVFHHDDRVVAAQLQHLALVGGGGRDVLADRHAAGEGHQVDVGVRQHLVGNLARVAGDDGQHLRRQPGLVQDIGQHEGRQRRLLAGLEHHAVVGGHRRRDLVDDLVERMVERRDCRDHAQQRLAQRIDLAALAVVRQVAREHLAVVDQRLVGGEQQHVGGAAHFIQRILAAQPGFQRDGARDLVQPRSDDLAGAHQDLVALVARQRGLVVARDAVGAAHVVQRGLGHGGDDLAGVRVGHLDHVFAVDLFAGDAQRFVADWDGLQCGHGLALAGLAQCERRGSRRSRAGVLPARHAQRRMKAAITALITQLAATIGNTSEVLPEWSSMRPISGSPRPASR